MMPTNAEAALSEALDLIAFFRDKHPKVFESLKRNQGWRQYLEDFKLCCPDLYKSTLEEYEKANFTFTLVPLDK